MSEETPDREEVDFYKGPLACSLFSHQFYETDLTRGFVRGYGLQVVRTFGPVSAALGGIGVAAFFCFMFSWVELLLARTLTSVDAQPIGAIMTRTIGASGIDWGVLAAAGSLTIIPGLLVIWFVRNHVAKGFALGRV